jgi:hypothetical protein
VSWSGSDNQGGSGLATYSVYVSDNGGTAQPFLTNTTLTTATFTGQNGNTYAFYSIATDNVGNVQPTPAAAQASTTVQLTVTPVVTVTDAGGPYNHMSYGATATATYNSSDVSSQGTFSFTYYVGPNTGGTSLGSTAPTTVGTYTVVGQFQSTSPAYGNADSAPVTFIVSRLSLSVTADDKSRPYGSPNPTLTGTLTGVVSGDNITASYTTTATSASPVIAGGYAITPVLSDPNSLLGNYTVTSTNGTLTLTAVPLTITADDKSMPYGSAALPTLTASYNGFVNNDTSASLTTPPTLSTTATTGSHVISNGGYPISATGAVDDNYAITYVGGTLTVTPVALTITADDKSMLYGSSTLPTLTASYSGFVNNDTGASLSTPPTLSTSATAGSHVIVNGGYPISATGAVDTDYAITYIGGTLTVTPVPLTITADDKSMPYGAPIPILTVSYGDLVNNDTNLPTPPTLSTTATSSSLPGIYPITASGAVDADYTIGYAGGTLTVTTAGTSLALSASANPSVFAQPITFTATVTASSPSTATPTGTVTLLDGTATLGSVSLTGGTGTLTIDSLVLGGHSIKAVYNATGPFGGSPPATLAQTVLSATVEPNALGPGQAGLVVGGTAGNDTISIGTGSKGTQLTVSVHEPKTKTNANFLFTRSFPVASVSGVVLFGGPGNDVLKVSKSITLPALLFGGAGNDTLTGGGGPSVLVGGDGNDTLKTVQPRGVLIGGAGSDRLTAPGGGLLIGGTTAFDTSLTALDAILAEWGRPGADYQTSVKDLLGPNAGGQAGGLNAPYYLNPTTVQNDSAVDHLTGGKGKSELDWFFSSALDVLVNERLSQGEVVTSIP